MTTKEKIIHYITLAIKGTGLLLGLKTLPLLAMLPPDGKVMVYAALIFALGSTLKEALYIVGDWLDDGKLNKSFKAGLLLLLLALLPLFLVACSAKEFRRKTGMTPSAAVGLGWDAYDSATALYDRYKAAKATSAKTVIDVQPEPLPPVEVNEPEPLTWWQSLKGIYQLFGGN